MLREISCLYIYTNTIKTKINNKAKRFNLSPQDLMQMYFFERILYRISISEYKYNFIIKGGLLLSSMFEDESRTTQDMDTMIKGMEISEETLEKVINDILKMDVGDNIIFKILGFRRIREEDLYGGYRVSIKAFAGTLSVNLKIDITTGDPIIPREIEYSYKCLIDEGTIKIMAFSKYSVIAEKFETLIETLETDTRAKDFYDIYYLSRTFNFDGERLQSAIFNTLQRRGTPYDRDSFKRVVSLADDEDMQKRWKYFLKTIKDDTLEFPFVIAEIQTFLEPVFDAIVNEVEWQKQWKVDLNWIKNERSSDL